MALPYTVKTASWIPTQQPTPLSLRKRADYYEQYLLKYPGCASFHSRAELYGAALKEGDPIITHLVPQPFKFRIGAEWYTPDLYLREGVRQVVIEMKPRGDFDKPWRPALEAYLRFHGMEFRVVANEWALEKEILAQNWLTIIRTLNRGHAFATDRLEQKLFNELIPRAGAPFGQLIPQGDPGQERCYEAALLRLLHRGQLRADLDQTPLSLDTWFSPCP